MNAPRKPCERLFSPRLSRRPALTLSMLVLCGLPILAEDQVPAPVPNPAPTGDQATGLRQVRAQAAYAAGSRARDESRLDDALQEFRKAVDLAPENEGYRKALRDTEALAGVSRDSRSLVIDRVADELAVRQQQLWVEAQSKLAEGTKALESGDYLASERAFQQAAIRLETLPFTDARREPELRKAEGLVKESRQRRLRQEQEQEASRNRAALDQQAQLRDLGLKIERDRIDAMLKRAQRARERRDFDEAITLCDQVLKINRAEERASNLLAKCRRERHSYLRQVTTDRWDEEHRLLTEQIRNAMLPQLELIKYSSDWPEIDARRGAPSQGSRDEGQSWRKKLNAELDQEITVDFQEMELVDVVAFLQKVSPANLLLDSQVLVKGLPPISFNVVNMKLRFVLDFIMRQTGLTYTMRNEAIFISNTEGVRGDIYMKIYDVRDLTHARQNFPGPTLDIPTAGQNGTQLLPPVEQEKKAETGEFIEIIKKVVAPGSWEGTKGIDIGEYNGSMVVTHTSEVHKQIDELLRSLRNQTATQIHVKVKFLTIDNAFLEEIGVNWNNFTGPAAAAGSGTTPLIPVAGQAIGTSGSATPFGAFYGHPGSSTVAAGKVTNSLTGSYASDNGLARPAGGTPEGLNLQTQYWQVAKNFYASAILTAVEKQRKGNVLYEPDLTMFNGQQAHLVHLRVQSYISDYDVVQFQYQPVVSQLSSGTALDVVAIASSDKKYITLTVKPTNSQIVRWRRFGGSVSDQDAQTLGGPIDPNVQPSIGSSGTNALGAAPLLIPEVSYQSSQTSVTIPDGGSLVIAGMTNGSSGREHSGVPFLSHIPFLGRLFSTNGRQETLSKDMILVQADLILFEEIEKGL